MAVKKKIAINNNWQILITRSHPEIHTGFEREMGENSLMNSKKCSGLPFLELTNNQSILIRLWRQ